MNNVQRIRAELETDCILIEINNFGYRTYKFVLFAAVATTFIFFLL